MLSGATAGKATSTYNESVEVNRWQGTTWSSKLLFAKFLPCS